MSRIKKQSNYFYWLCWFFIVSVNLLFLFAMTNQSESNFDWSLIRSEIRDSISIVEKYNRITSGVIGMNGITPAQYYTRLWLMQNVDKTEVVLLTGHPNSVVKATAYETLLRKANGNPFELIQKTLKDTTTIIHYQSGCIGEPKILGEYLVEDVLRLSFRELKHEKLTKIQKDTVLFMYKKLNANKWKYINQYY